MKEVIELPIKHPELFESLGISQPKVFAHKMASLAGALIHPFPLFRGSLA